MFSWIIFGLDMILSVIIFGFLVNLYIMIFGFKVIFSIFSSYYGFYV